ncbi:hypothetical protein AVEN_195342-1 [Araneus ventricosus]|uniref:Uncharacterized protein n=1 Tax=Araneus ventricosus TaxID=182803 RepID=A0A4Y2V259_ARAVE|nr:hypothetical protein AVEN_195342-1 [Araneus ventricosus]
MTGKIDYPPKSELFSIVRFLQEEGSRTAEIHPRMRNDDFVREWCRKRKDGRTDVHDEDGQGRKPFACEDLAHRIQQVVREEMEITSSFLETWRRV